MSSLRNITCHNLSIGYLLESPLFENINLSLDKGDVICIMGANGVGKSTFLKTLSAQLPPLKGEITFNENKLDEFSQAQIARMISIVHSSSPNFHPGLKVKELLAFSRAPYTSFWGSLSSKDQQVIDQMLEKFEIKELADRSLMELSDGQRQKVMIARALVQETPLILLDEPTTYLDLKNQITVLLLLKRLALEFQKTIVFTSHHWELILELATKVWYFNEDQKQIEQTSPEDLILTRKWQHYLDLEMAQFDEQDGRFKLNACDAYPIELSGEFLQQKWTAHHLTKHGYYHGTSDLKCVCLGQSWRVTLGPASLEAGSIVELVQKLKSLPV